MSITRKIMGHWQRTTPEVRASGVAWYRDARRLISTLARKYGRTRCTVAGIVAATSPRQSWGRNVVVSEEFLAGGAPSGVFRDSATKARAILAGAKPLVVLGGRKVRAFYRALCGDDTACVIDVWMLRACGLSGTARPNSNGLYARVERAVVAAARQLRVSVTEFQATLWITIRGSAA